MSTASQACAARGFSNIAGPARRAGRDRGAERPLRRVEIQQIMAQEEMTSNPWRWEDGLVPQAMRQGWWLLLDEVNLAEPQILERLNSVLELDPSLVLTEHAVPLPPLAGEIEHLSHIASFLSALCSSDNRKGKADARA